MCTLGGGSGFVLKKFGEFFGRHAHTRAPPELVIWNFGGGVRGLPLDHFPGVAVIVVVVTVIVDWLVTLAVIGGVEIRNVRLVRLDVAIIDERAPRALNDHGSLLGSHW